MTIAIIIPDDFSLPHRSLLYGSWVAGLLRAQGIRFLPGLSIIPTVEAVEAHIVPPWSAECINSEGAIRYWQGEPTPGHPPSPAP